MGEARLPAFGGRIVLGLGFSWGKTLMKRALRMFGLAMVAWSLWGSLSRADVLAEYDAMGAAPNPNTQGWTWNGGDTVVTGQAALLITGADNPPVLFTQTVPTNVFFDPWSFTGSLKFAGNSQEEFGRMMFVDDGTNIWHLSFLNTGADSADGIYNGGNPVDPNPLANTATKVWAEPVDPNFAVGSLENKPFELYHDYAIVDSDGAGGAAPRFYLDGAAVPAVSLLPEPSKFPAGTIGFGSLNIHETGFLQIQRLVFDGNPNAVPEPSALVLLAAALCGLAPFTRRFRS